MNPSTDPVTAPLPMHISRLSADLDADRDRKIVRDIAPDDIMYTNWPDAYFGAGQSALRSLRLGMLAADLKRANRILDFGCAYGRVLRSLRAGFPDATITACELRKPDLEWCRKTFGPKKIIAAESAFEPDEIKLEGNYDLIWCGSILSHVDQDRWPRFLKLFEANLAPGGVAVFTVYGRYIADRMRNGRHLLNFTLEQASRVLRDYDDTGFGFHVTPLGVKPGATEAWAVRQGDTLVSRAWVCSQLDMTPSLELVGYNERGWMTQDVVTVSKTFGRN